MVNQPLKQKKMHNLHFIVVKSDTAENAMAEAENAISDWGNENNYRSFGGCVSENNEVYRVPQTGTWGNSRWVPYEKHTIQMINNQVTEWMKPQEYTEKGFNKIVSGESDTAHDWWSAKSHCERMYQTAMTKGLMKDRTEFDVLQDEFFAWDFNENGVTCLDLTQQQDDGGDTLFVVFVDMHD